MPPTYVAVMSYRSTAGSSRLSWRLCIPADSEMGSRRRWAGCGEPLTGRQSTTFQVVTTAQHPDEPAFITPPACLRSVALHIQSPARQPQATSERFRNRVALPPD